MGETVRHAADRDWVVGSGGTVQLRSVRLRERRWRAPETVEQLIVFRRELGPKQFDEADRLHHELEKVATALDDGSYGWSVVVDTRDRHVRVRLVSRLFDGEALRVEIAAERTFDAADAAALEASAAFRGELEELAETRNARDRAALDDRTLAETARWRSVDQARVDAEELAGILRR